MRLTLLALLLAGFVAAHTAFPGEPKLIGTWQMVAATKNGKKVPEEQVKATVVVIDGKTIRFQEGASKNGEYGYKVDPTARPPALDILEGENLIAIGIYELKGDDLKIAVNKTGERPKDFDKLGAESGLLILQRKK